MNQPMLSIVAAGGEHPLIDMDGTILIQFGLFLIMAFLATQWLFRPYLQMREERREGIEGSREEAVRLAAEADAAMADYEARLGAARSAAYEEQRTLRAEATAFQRKHTDESRQQASAMLEEARAKIASEADAARAELMPRADMLARDIATKLLGREVA